ncbi:gamma-glutamylcyclotransferase (GGCT)/AIG2-like uncharacterized protein YtfP [Sphingomonas zeicaulis]|uniref:gamma-glutamylcyclotransferase family protein n=1 Tax=Sphingomonas zeicaulis TaxID=1632740 RepID=UPI003D247897
MGTKSFRSSGSVLADQSCRLFAYGTLRDPAVQQRLFGRGLEGDPDALSGYVPGTILIGGTTYPILHRGNADDCVPGIALAMTAAELHAADAYEGADYARITVTLESGRRAFVYVSAGLGG